MTQKGKIFVGALVGAFAVLLAIVGSANGQGYGIVEGTNTGDVSLSACGSTANANGASLSGQALNLQPASASYCGVMSTGAQTIAGAKTYTSPATVVLNQLQNTFDAGLVLANNTTADGGIVSQYSPGILYRGSALGADGGDGASVTVECRDYLVPVSAPTTPTGYMTKECRVGTGAWGETMRLTAQGVVTLTSAPVCSMAGVGAGTPDGILLTNPTDSDVIDSVVQNSPALRFYGSGFALDGGAGAPWPVTCRERLVPVSAGLAASGYMLSECSVNDAGWVETARITTTGALTLAGGLTVGGNTQLNGTIRVEDGATFVYGARLVNGAVQLKHEDVTVDAGITLGAYSACVRARILATTGSVTLSMTQAVNANATALVTPRQFDATCLSTTAVVGTAQVTVTCVAGPTANFDFDVCVFPAS